MICPKAVLFDFDGTIANSHEAAIKTYQFISEKYGLKSANSVDLANLKGMATRDVLKDLGIPLLKLPWLMREARLQFRRHVHLLQPVQGILAALTDLKQ